MIKNEINAINTVIASLNLIDRWGGYAIHKTDSKNGIPYGVSIMKDCFGNVYTYDDRVETVGYLSVERFSSTTQYRQFVRLPVTYTIHLFNNLAKMGEKERYWQKAILILKELKKKYTDVNIESVVTGLPDKVEYCQITIKQSYVIPCDYTYDELDELCDGAGLITPKCIKYTVNIFISSGTYVKPANLETAYVLMVSGGGGGGSGRRGAPGSNRGGGGASNGIALLLKFKPQELNTTEPVIVGAGGVGAPPQTTDNTSGFNGGVGGTTIFKNDCILSGGITQAGSIFPISSLNASINFNLINNYYSLINYYQNKYAIGDKVIEPKYRVNDTNALFETSLLFSNTSIGGQIFLNNAQESSGGIGGFYDANNNLVGEMPGALPESGDGQQATEYFTFGEFLNKIFHWFDPAHAPQIVGRGGVGGACGDLNGTIPGGKGGDAIGFGAGGGGGGTSTNGANSGAGGNGGNGIVIIINVLK